METLFKIVLPIHIVVGYLSFFIGLIIIFLRKGDKRHQKLGKAFYWLMFVAVTSAIYMSIQHWNPFLLMLGPFTFYALYMGKRFLKWKMKDISTAVTTIDWLVYLVFTANTVAMLAIGVFSSSPMKTVILVFGILCIPDVYKDFRRFTGRRLSTDKKEWLREHIGRMTGAFIAGTTAFLVNNPGFLANYVPVVLIWLGPTILLVPMIIRWQRKYAKVAKKAVH